MKNNEYKEVIGKIDRGQLEKFMLGILAYNKDVENMFRSEFVGYLPKMTKKEYGIRIKDAINRACDRQGYINYNLTHVYSQSMYEFIHESENLVKSGNYSSAFDIIEEILDSIPNTDIDDSDGTTGDIADDCMKVIKDILKYSLTSDKDVSDRILNFLLSEIKTKALSNYGIELYPLLDYYIDEKRNLDKIETCLKDYINSHGDDRYTIAKYREILAKIDKKKEKVD